MCVSCQHSFTAQTSVVKKNCYVSQNVKSLIVIKATEARSIKSIARDCSVSSPTVQRQINEAAKLFTSHHQALPENLSFDEFKYAKGEMAFEYINAMTTKDFETLKFHLDEPVNPLISGYIKTSLKTLRKHLPYIQNSFIYPYNNGCIEGVNNKTKVLNRVAYGYRSFMNYRKRILIHFKFKPIVSNLR